MKQEKSTSQKGFTHALLQFLDDLGRPTIGYAYNVGGYTPWPKVSRVYYRRTFARMKKFGWVEEAERGGKKFFKLTKKGRMEVLCRKLKEIKEPDKLKWNGSWWIGLFDIPEHKGRRDRDQLRIALKRAGFSCLQKSVYIYPGEIPELLIDYLHTSGLSRFIRFLHVDRADDPNDLKKRCGI